MNARGPEWINTDLKKSSETWRHDTKFHPLRIKFKAHLLFFLPERSTISYSGWSFSQMWFEDQTSADDDSEIWKSEVNKKPLSEVTGVMPILKEHDVVLGER